MPSFECYFTVSKIWTTSYKCINYMFCHSEGQEIRRNHEICIFLSSNYWKYAFTEEITKNVSQQILPDSFNPLRKKKRIAVGWRETIINKIKWNKIKCIK